MKTAFVGCGWVADLYASTLSNHPEIEWAGVYDRDPKRADAFARHHKVRRYDSYEQLLNDKEVELIANLTNPGSHYEVSKAALEAGKHVYSEKPLAMEWEDAKSLAALAKKHGVMMAGAPATALGEAAQTAWKAIREGRIGTPRLAYAELDDGPIHMLDFQNWRSDSGAPWPWRDEFEVGCTLEHAGYYVGWLVAFFGQAKRVTSFASLVTPDKGVPNTPTQPDFSVGCIEFESGVSARVTCSIYGSHDHNLRIFGDEGVLVVKEAWNFDSFVGWYPRNKATLKAEKYLAQAHHAGLALLPIQRVKSGIEVGKQHSNRIDFARGLAEVISAVKEKRVCRLGADVALHVNEIVLQMARPDKLGDARRLESKLSKIEPMNWAK
jgi:predicted dehydrogenase